MLFDPGSVFALFKKERGRKKVYLTGCTEYKSSWVAIWQKIVDYYYYNPHMIFFCLYLNVNSVQVIEPVLCPYHHVTQALKRLMSFWIFKRGGSPPPLVIANHDSLSEFFSYENWIRKVMHRDGFAFASYLRWGRLPKRPKASNLFGANIKLNDITQLEDKLSTISLYFLCRVFLDVSIAFSVFFSSL